MPKGKRASAYKSAAQRAWAHTPTGQKALGKAEVERKDKASKGKKLPKKAKSKGR